MDQLAQEVRFPFHVSDHQEARQMGQQRIERPGIAPRKPQMDLAGGGPPPPSVTTNGSRPDIMSRKNCTVPSRSNSGAIPRLLSIR